jgi:glucose/mannose transport system substrate-binding protein
LFAIEQIVKHRRAAQAAPHEVQHWEDIMNILKSLLATAAVTTVMIGAAAAEPKTLMLHQWATGSDAASIAKLGEMFTAKGGKWEQNAIAGHTANTLAKLRADVLAGNAPAAVQLKGPEIAEWNETGTSTSLPPPRAGKRWWHQSFFR